MLKVLQDMQRLLRQRWQGVLAGLIIIPFLALVDNTAWATVGVVKYGSGTPVYVCQPNDTNPSCGSSSGGSGTGSCVTGTFTNSSLSSGILTITHSFNLTAPYAVNSAIYDNTNTQDIPDGAVGSANSVAINLTSYRTLTGTWGYSVCSTSGGGGGGGPFLLLESSGYLLLESGGKIIL